MNKIKVSWKKGSHAKVKPEVAHRFFERVRKEHNGVLDLDAIVHASKPKDAPLHNEFEWNDKQCGVLYRREQARYLVRSLEYVPAEMPEAKVRAYESITVESPSEDDPKPEKRVFMRTEDILANPAARADLLGQAVRDALAFRKRYSALSELSLLIEVIDDTVRKLG